MDLYHGTRKPFRKGGYLFPSSVTGHVLRSAGLHVPDGWVDDRGDYVYVTPDYELAECYAFTAPDRGLPRILTVQPLDELEVDNSTYNGEWVESYRTTSAEVLKVIMISAERRFEWLNELINND